MTRISISGIHNYSNDPFCILKILELMQNYPRNLFHMIGWN